MASRFVAVLAVGAMVLTAPAQARDGQVSEARVRAHEAFLAGPALRGRESASPDEAIAAAYVAAQFQSYGIGPAPGVGGYFQTAPVVRQRLAGPPQLAIDGAVVAGATLLTGEGGEVGGTIAVLRAGAAPTGRAGALLVLDPAARPAAVQAAARAIGARLILLPESAMTRRLYEGAGGRPRLPARLATDPPREPRTAIVAVAPALMAPLSRPGTSAVLSVPVTIERTVTTNAIGFIPGTDPTAKLILLTAHLDHLGPNGAGETWYGANDDASGVVALLEIARALATGPRPRRGVMIVGYGAEEIGTFGSRWLAAHPPVPLDRIAANLEFEMVGEQDPALPRNTLMMTGYARSDLGSTLRARGAAVTADPYPEEHFFERSDNYALAQRGIVAHTVSGKVGATYHTPRDTVESLDYGYMLATIRSLIGPVRFLANSRFEPRWAPGGRPPAE